MYSNTDVMGQQMDMQVRPGTLNFKGGTASFHSGVDFFPVLPPEGFYPEEEPMMGFDEDEMYAEYESPLPDLQVPEDEYLFDDEIPEDEYTDEHLQNIEAMLDQYESGEVQPEEEQMSDPSMEFDEDYLN